MMKLVGILITMAHLVVAPYSLPTGLSQTSSAQTERTFRTPTSVVTIPASVRTKGGRPMQGLTVNDFEVRDNGVLRPILSLARIRTLP